MGNDMSLDISSPEPSAERRLWCAVIVRAIDDLAIDRDSSDEARQNREDVIRWLGKKPRRDFIEVCHRAGVEPRRTHARMLEIVGMSKDEVRKLTRRPESHGELVLE
jgi:hypothetical protein